MSISQEVKLIVSKWFVSCSLVDVEVRIGHKRISLSNNPININLIHVIEKSQFENNFGISFMSVERKETWVFETEAQRDAIWHQLTA